MWFFAFVLLSGAPILLAQHLRGMAMAPAPSLLYGPTLVYAILVKRFVDRVGARGWIIYLTLTADLMAMGAPSFMLRSDAALMAQARLFAPYLMPAGQLLVLFVNAQRQHRASAFYGAALSTVYTVAVLQSVVGHLEPPVVGIVMGFVITALLSAMSARQARHALETFARLQLLRRYLQPAAVARVLTDDPDRALALGGRSCTVTILAADLRGFTQMSEKLAPEEVVRQLNAYHGTMLEAIESHGGALDKFIGDGILAVFGLDAAGDGPSDAGAAAAVRGAQAMLAALAQLNRSRAVEKLPPLAMGIGVHTGAVVAGNLGAPGRRLEFTVIGDAVNTASRIEGMTKELGRALLVSHATVERLPSGDGLEPLPPVTLRGRDAPLVLYAHL